MQEEKKYKKDNDDKNSNSRLFKTVVIFLLLVIIILLLLRGCSTNITRTNFLMPTGDYDIIEINCDCSECPTSSDDKTSNTQSTTTNKKTNNTTTNEGTGNNSNNTGDYSPDEDETGFIVYDKKNSWTGNYQSNIFTHASYDITSGKIAPGSTNIYKFIVKNMNDFKVKYTIKFKETNLKNIPMKYRLKRENSYIVGSSSQWVDATSLAVALKNLNSKSEDTYYLEWKWFEDDSKDFTIGVNDNVTYSLNIKVDAEED